MEPISLAASILTLIRATTTTGSTLSRLWGLRGLPIYVVTALNEINDFKAALTLVYSAVDNGDELLADNTSTEIDGLLSRAKRQLTTFDNFLRQNVLSEGEDKHGNLRLRRKAKIKEVLGEAHTQVETLRQELLSIKVSLSVVLAALQLRTFPKLLMSIQQITMAQPGRLPVSVDTNTTTHTAAIVEGCITANSTLRPSVAQHPDFPMQPSPQTALQSNRDQNTYMVMQTKPLGQVCKPRCPCQCHIPFQGHSPRWLRELIGSAFFQFTGTPVLNHRSCNFKLCGKQVDKSGSVSFQYVFPIWLLRLGIIATGSWNFLDGLGAKWSLRIPKVITDPDLKISLYKSLNTRSVGNLRNFMEGNCIRPYDIIWDQYMLLHRSILEAAIHFSTPETCQMLLQSVDLSYQTYEEISLAQHVRFATMLNQPFQKLLTSAGLEDELESDNLELPPLHSAVLEPLKHDIEQIIENDPSSVFSRDTFGLCALHWATLKDDPNALDALLRAGADVHARCALVEPILNCMGPSLSLICCEKVLDPKRTVNKQALIEILRLGKAPSGIGKPLLKREADIDAHHLFGQSSIFLAARNASVEVFKMLVDYGADINDQDSSGCSVFQQAIIGKNHPVLGFLSSQWENGNAFSLRVSDIWTVASYGDEETFHILREANIGSSERYLGDIKDYWELFELQDRSFFGNEVAAGVEKEEFQALLEKIAPGSFAELPLESLGEDFSIPGSFPGD